MNDRDCRSSRFDILFVGKLTPPRRTSECEEVAATALTPSANNSNAVVSEASIAVTARGQSGQVLEDRLGERTMANVADPIFCVDPNPGNFDRTRGILPPAPIIVQRPVLPNINVVDAVSFRAEMRSHLATVVAARRSPAATAACNAAAGAATSAAVARRSPTPSLAPAERSSTTRIVPSLATSLGAAAAVAFFRTMRAEGRTGRSETTGSYPLTAHWLACYREHLRARMQTINAAATQQHQPPQVCRQMPAYTHEKHQQHQPQPQPGSLTDSIIPALRMQLLQDHQQEARLEAVVSAMP